MSMVMTVIFTISSTILLLTVEVLLFKPWAIVSHVSPHSFRESLRDSTVLV